MSMPDEVTINTVDREEIHRFVRALPEEWGLVDEDGSTLSETIDQVQSALRRYNNPPPVPEPGLWTVAKTIGPDPMRHGPITIHVRTHADWVSLSGDRRDWFEVCSLGTVEILNPSPGEVHMYDAEAGTLLYDGRVWVPGADYDNAVAKTWQEAADILAAVHGGNQWADEAIQVYRDRAAVLGSFAGSSEGHSE